MATHSGILTWRIPWMEEPGGLQSIGLERLLTYQNNLYLKFSVFLFLVCLLSFFLNLRLTEKSANSLQSSFFLNHLRLSCQHDVSSSLDNLLCIFLKIETFSYTAGWCKYQSQEFNTDTLLPPNPQNPFKFSRCPNNITLSERIQFRITMCFCLISLVCFN